MTNTYSQLPVATYEQTLFFLKVADNFLKTTGGLYSSAGSGPKLAIADYIASKNGFQLLRSS